MISPLSLLSLVLYSLAAAATDSAPCISGTCTYQSGDGSNTAWSVLAINTESPTSLSDITAAAGWDIIECDPHSTGPQDIRLVCTDRSKGCDQLFEGGEENTIIRLPDTCAGGPFARVVKSWIPDDQTVPARLTKRQLDAPVRALTLDFDFSQIPVSNGEVYITATATNSRAQRDALTRAAAKRSLEPLRHATRSGLGRAAIRDFVEASKKRTASPEQVRNTAIGGAKGDADNAGDTIGEVIHATTGAVQDFAHPIGHATHFNKSISKTVHLIDIDESFPVITASLTCAGSGPRPEFETSIAFTAAVKAKMDAEVGFIITGSIIPPRLDDLAFTSNLHGHVSAAFDVQASVTGTFDTGAIPLYETGLPGLSFPGILTVGPSFSLNAQGKVSLGVTADIKVSSTFDLPQINLVFPPSQGQSAAQVVPGPTPIKVDVASSVELKGRVEVHIIPRLDVGVKILNGLTETTVYLDVDGSAGVEFTLSAGADFTPVSGTNELPVVALKDVETKFGGTVGADVGVSINAGATAELVPFFDQTVSVELFSKTFPIFKHTFGEPATKRSVLLERAVNYPGLFCPLSGEINIKQPILDLDAPAPQQ